MNKQQNRLLELDKIYNLISVPGNLFESVKRYKLGTEKLSANEVREAYKRRGVFINELKHHTENKWYNLLAHIDEISLSVYRDGHPALHDLFELKSFLYHYLALRSYSIERSITNYQLPDLEDLFVLLDPEGGRIPHFRLSPLYSNTLQTLNDRRQELSNQLRYTRRMFLHEAIDQLGISGLKEEFVLSRTQTDLIQKIQTSQYFRLKQESIANLIFTLADSLEANSIKREITDLNTELEEEENRILDYLGIRIAEYSDKIKQALGSLKELGWDFALAVFATNYSCCIPCVDDKIALQGARNLALELSLRSQKRPYQNLDLEFGIAANLITGPNMGGKTTILRCLAQFANLLKRAIPLPSDKAVFPFYDFVYYNHASEKENLSSFGSEVVSFSQAIQLEGRGLFLLDEFAKGTNPREGEALATAVIQYLTSSPHTCVAATHFTAPTLLQNINQYQIKGIDAALHSIDSDDLGERLRILAKAMDYSLLRLEDNKKPPMDAFRIAEILGMPKDIMHLLSQKS